MFENKHSREIRAIEDKYGLFIFRCSITHLVDVGVQNLTAETVEETILQAAKEDANNKDSSKITFISLSFQSDVMRCAQELAQLPIWDLLAYIKSDVHIDGCTSAHISGKQKVNLIKTTPRDKIDQLIDRLNRNLSAYIDSLADFRGDQIIEIAGRIHAIQDTHFYMTEHHAFTYEQAEYLLRFQNPLDFVSDMWQERTNDISDMSFVLENIFDKQDAPQHYPLV